MKPESAPVSSTSLGELDPALKRWLLAHGFPRDDDIEAVVDNQTTPLMHACRLGDRATVDALIEAGAPMNAVNGDGNNALWMACYQGDLHVIERLIRNGIAIDHQNEGGATCLMYAASSGKTAVVARLLELGAATDIQNPDDLTALDMAANPECLQVLRAASRKASSGGSCTSTRR